MSNKAINRAYLVNALNTYNTQLDTAVVGATTADITAANGIATLTTIDADGNAVKTLVPAINELDRKQGDAVLTVVDTTGGETAAKETISDAINVLDKEVGDANTLTVKDAANTLKKEVVAAINELDAKQGDAVLDVLDTTGTAVNNLSDAVNALEDKMGNLADLKTDDKTGIIAAINEHEEMIGVRAGAWTLTTTDQTLAGAIDELDAKQGDAAITVTDTLGGVATAETTLSGAVNVLDKEMGDASTITVVDTVAAKTDTEKDVVSAVNVLDKELGNVDTLTVLKANGTLAKDAVTAINRLDEVQGDDVLTVVDTILEPMSVTATTHLTTAVNILDKELGENNEFDTDIDDKTSVVKAINSVYKQGKVTITPDTTNTALLKTYIFTQDFEADGTTPHEIGRIELAKDLVVTAGECIIATGTETRADGTSFALDADKSYLKLTIANQVDPVYIDTRDLVNDYTVKAAADKLQLAISADREISADVVAHSLGHDDLNIDTDKELLFTGYDHTIDVGVAEHYEKCTNTDPDALAVVPSGTEVGANQVALSTVTTVNNAALWVEDIGVNEWVKLIAAVPGGQNQLKTAAQNLREAINEIKDKDGYNVFAYDSGTYAEFLASWPTPNNSIFRVTEDFTRYDNTMNSDIWYHAGSLIFTLKSEGETDPSVVIVDNGAGIYWKNITAHYNVTYADGSTHEITHIHKDNNHMPMGTIYYVDINERDKEVKGIYYKGAGIEGDVTKLIDLYNLADRSINRKTLDTDAAKELSFIGYDHYTNTGALPHWERCTVGFTVVEANSHLGEVTLDAVKERNTAANWNENIQLGDTVRLTNNVTGADKQLTTTAQNLREAVNELDAESEYHIKMYEIGTYANLVANIDDMPINSMYLVTDDDFTYLDENNNTKIGNKGSIFMKLKSETSTGYNLVVRPNNEFHKVVYFGFNEGSSRLTIDGRNVTYVDKDANTDPKGTTYVISLYDTGKYISGIWTKTDSGTSGAVTCTCDFSDVIRRNLRFRDQDDHEINMNIVHYSDGTWVDAWLKDNSVGHAKLTEHINDELRIVGYNHSLAQNIPEHYELCASSATGALEVVSGALAGDGKVTLTKVYAVNSAAGYDAKIAHGNFVRLATVTGDPQLTTTAQSLVAAVNELDAKQGDDVLTVTDTTGDGTVKTDISAAVNVLDKEIGNASELTVVKEDGTTVANVLVEAINELDREIGDTVLTTDNKVVTDAINELNTKIGDLTTLTTTVQTDLVSAINEVNTRAAMIWMDTVDVTGQTTLVNIEPFVSGGCKKGYVYKFENRGDAVTIAGVTYYNGDWVICYQDSDPAVEPYLTKLGSSVTYSTSGGSSDDGDFIIFD